MSKKPSQKSENKKQHVTKISAKARTDVSAKASNTIKTNPKNPTISTHKTKKSHKNHKSEKPLRQVFILARPFVTIGRYLRDSWHELRQVRWPNRAATWKMTLAVLVYCVIFIIFITLLDSLFTFIFNLLLGQS